MARPFDLQGWTDDDPMIISDDEDVAVPTTRDATQREMREPSSGTDLTLDEEENENEMIFERDLTTREAQDFEEARARSVRLPPGHRLKNSAVNKFGVDVQPGMDVELLEGAFLRVKQLIQDPFQNIKMNGWLMKRNSDVHCGTSKYTGEPLHALLPLPKNDVCLTLKTTPGKLGNLQDDECMVTRPLDEAFQTREIIFTNFDSPNMSYIKRGKSVFTHGRYHIEDHEVLCCRFKFVEEVDTKGTKTVAYQLMQLRREECDEDYGQPDVVRRREFRGQKDERKTKFTSADFLAGGGGVTRAMVMAGLDLRLALDNCPVAVETLKKNFGRRRVLYQSIQDFVATVESDKEYVVDVVHISFPCQGHSRMNRNQNPERDFANNVTVTAVKGLLRKCRPRIVTLEQTDHILTTNEGHFFRMVISDLTSEGYSTRWKTFNTALHGVPQARKRLMILAACPGEKMPDWPEETHGSGRGLKPLRTIDDVTQEIPSHDRLHDVNGHKLRYRIRPRSKLPIANRTQPLRHLIMTKGVQVLFRDPDGSVYWPTIRQQMRLQTFPDNHVLTGNTQEDYTKQIGNAVPCVFMKQTFEKVIETLKESDREAEEWDNHTIVIS